MPSVPSVGLVELPVANAAGPAAASPRSAGRAGARRALRRHPAALPSAAFLAVVVLAGLLAPVLFPGDPMSIVAEPLLWPGTDPAHPLGTDSLGRDLLAALVHGARVSLQAGLLATAVGLAIGVTIGAVSGYFGGWVDALLSRVIELFQILPSFLTVVVIMAITQPSIAVLSLAIALVTWPTVARLTRTEFLSIREKDFIVAARGLGYGHARLIWSEILPNALPPIIVTASAMVASAILMESAISFLGLGDANVVSWGSMIGAGREYLRSAWYVCTVPGFAIMFTALSLNALADALNDVLNPRAAARRA